MGIKNLSMLALAGSAAASLPPISIKGTKFFYENGTQFFMKGVAYQQEVAAKGATNDVKSDFIDPLIDEDLCKRDIPLLKELGTNVIRTYAIDPTKDHSACMKLLDAAGIYVVSDLSQPEMSINRDTPQWNTDLQKRYNDVVDELAQYTNTIGFFAGNEVSDASNNTEASAYVKAALRDTKKHIKDSGYRPMGVGYASNDHPDIRQEIAEYFNCGPDAEATDFWGYNIYSWCGESDMQKSGYNDQIKFFENYNVPVFFAEYGCNVPDGAEGRIFQETAALYSDPMTEVFSGGIVYMYFEESNDYGLVKVDGSGNAKKLKNYSNLKQQVLKADPKTVDEDTYKPTGQRDQCPAIGKVWRANSVLPPTPDSALCSCMVDDSTCGPASNLQPKDFGDVFNFICDAKPELCAAIGGNATTGVYGAYSMCDDRSKLTYVLDAYYKEQNNAADACDFKGAATTKKSSAASSCSKALDAAAALNEQVATATAAFASSTASASTDADESFGVPSAPMGRLLSVGTYVVAAMGAGAFLVAL